MPCRLRREEIVAIQVLADKKVPNTEIARQLGVTEGNVRYHLKRKEVEDGRRKKPFKAEKYAEHIQAYVEAHASQDKERPINVLDLHEHLVENHDYPWGYKSVLRYVRARYPKPRISEHGHRNGWITG